ncbi:MAG: outer membrane protein assembly factor BamA [Helicobacteraceae bacterium]|jgi:outer membrane protein insertion porin family|nr:outer membrane protein assembly factor BamA [Helicobacteraceae bacterium]
MRILLLIAICAASLWAKVYSDVRFEGLLRLSPLSATEIIGFGAREDVSEERINSAIQRLFAQQYFTDISVEEQGGALIFRFKEKPVVANISFKGLSETEINDKYLPVFGIKRGEIYDQGRVEAAKKRLILLSQSEGYYDPLVEVETQIDRKNNRADLIVTYAKGNQITISEVNIAGAKALDKSDLQKQLANRERQAFGWFPGRSSGELKLLELPYDSARMRDVYLRYGYLDAEVSDPFLRADFDSYFATLDYTVVEGEQYGVSSVSIESKERSGELNFLLPTLKLQPMNRFDITRMRADLNTIREEAAGGGYAFARVTPDIRKNAENHTASIVYYVEYGKKVYIRDVIITGNSRTLDRVIRREIFLAHGDLYSLRDIRESKASLGRLGFFEDVQIDEQRVSETEMDLLVTVKETSTGSLAIGGGYSTYDGFIFNASISDRNLLGSGFGYGLAIDTSKRTRRFELSLDNPRVRDSLYSLSFSLYNTHYEATTYVRDSEGGSITLGRRFGRNLRSSLTTSASNNKNEYEEPDDFYVNGETSKLSLTPSVSYDTTDDYFVPREGFILSQSLEFAGFGQDEEYTKSSTSFAFYYGFSDLLDYDLIFRYRARFQAIKADIDDIVKYPIASRLFLGGTRSVRGYQSGSIAPYRYDSSGEIARDSNGDVRYMGGKMAFNNSVELSIPVIEEARMRFTFFYDFGAIGIDDLSMQRSSCGVAFEWFSPMGPLQLIFATPIDDEPQDTISRVEFSLGQRF